MRSNPLTLAPGDTPPLKLHREPALFRAGVFSYAVKIADAPIVLDGGECYGLCDEADETIHLAGPEKLKVKQRLWVLLHELAHAQVFATGFPCDIESLCDLVATIATGAFRQLAACGGEEALMRLDPGDTLAAGIDHARTRG